MAMGGGPRRSCSPTEEDRLGFDVALAKAKDVASSAPVVVFSKTYCEYCKQVKKLLTQLGASYKVFELDVESDGTALQSALIEWTGQRTVPNVFIGGNHIGSFDGTKSFITNLFQALEDGSIAIANKKLDVIKKLELSLFPTMDTVQRTSSSPKEKIHSFSSSEPDSDPEDKELSDDDDRNHKHRRREVRPHSLDNDLHAPPIRRPNRKRNKPFENGQPYLETGPQSSEIEKEYNPSLERDVSSKSEKRGAGLTPQMRAPSDSGPRARLNQFHTDTGSRFDSSASTGRPSIGRGRGRNTVPWSQHDSRFNHYDTLDLASQIASQGPPTHPSLYAGTGLPSAANTQNASWGAYRFIPGMNNTILDPLHPLGLQGTLQPPISPLLNIGALRQRCRDFEERGFCLRGDMCLMEHGVNRIVVEDVQSLSQFNLPVSIPSSHALGILAGAGSLPPVSAFLSLLTSSKAASMKNNKSGVTDDALKLNGVSSASGVSEADVYDPDQPLWNNEHPETSSAHLRLPSPKNNSVALWGADCSARPGLRLSDGIGNEHPGRSFMANIGSVWGRIGPGNKSETGRKANSHMTVTSHIGNEMKEDHEETMAYNHSATEGTRAVGKAMGPKATAVQPLPRLRADSGRNGGKASQRASCTLYVNGIPQKINRREALLSHFQKFGEVIDVYIPLNSEKAFVQFSMREEAEAALKAPDAVMGNRFIKLWWANRDTISDEGDGGVHNKSMQFPGVAAPFVASQLSIGDRGKENLPSAAPKGSSVLGAEASVPAGGPPQSLSANCLKAAPPVQKKLEGLEILKEELHKKQEILDKKRDEFWRQLHKLEKQAISSKKKEVASEQAGKRHKVDMANEAVAARAAVAPRSTNLCTTGAHLEAERTLEKRNSGEILVPHSSKENSSALQQSPGNIKQTSHLPGPVLDRFKQENSPTSFRVVRPLPAELANVVALKDHFSYFGDLSSVVLEEPEDHTKNESLKPSQNCSACISFTTRHSAMNAFLNGKHWQGHNLWFTWLTAFPNYNSDHSIQETSTPMGALSPDVQAEVVTSSSSNAGKPACNVMSQVAAIRNGGSLKDAESTNCALITKPKALVQTSHSSTISCEEHPPMSDVPMVGAAINVGFSQ